MNGVVLMGAALASAVSFIFYVHLFRICSGKCPELPFMFVKLNQ